MRNYSKLISFTERILRARNGNRAAALPHTLVDHSPLHGSATVRYRAERITVGLSAWCPHTTRQGGDAENRHSSAFELARLTGAHAADWFEVDGSGWRRDVSHSSDNIGRPWYSGRECSNLKHGSVKDIKAHLSLSRSHPASEQSPTSYSTRHPNTPTCAHPSTWFLPCAHWYRPCLSQRERTAVSPRSMTIPRSPSTPCLYPF